MQKALLSLGESRKAFIIEEALDKLEELSNDANGLCLIKKLIPVCSKSPELVKRIVGVMAKCSVELAQNPYGNYAIQVALDSFVSEQCEPLLESLKGKYAQLSMLKFSSNAVERCLEKAELPRRNIILKELTGVDKLLGITPCRHNCDSTHEEQLRELRRAEGAQHRGRRHEG